jgi:hypothetical protein
MALVSTQSALESIGKCCCGYSATPWLRITAIVALSITLVTTLVLLITGVRELSVCLSLSQLTSVTSHETVHRLGTTRERVSPKIFIFRNLSVGIAIKSPGFHSVLNYMPLWYV